MTRKKVAVDVKIKLILSIPKDMVVEDAIREFETDVDYDFKMLRGDIKVLDTEYQETKLR